MKIELENLLIKACQEGINIFTGAGFSIDSYDKSGKRLPLGFELSVELSDKFHASPTLPLPNMASIIESKDRINFYAFLKDRMNVVKFDNEYLQI
ncbi:MAG TPA: hypothetical protein VK543_04065 [Puia sp.]|nr:hypothetical protein [Puia sp.]